MSNAHFEAGLAWPLEPTAILDEAVRCSTLDSPTAGTAAACWFGTYRESWTRCSTEERTQMIESGQKP